MADTFAIPTRAMAIFAHPDDVDFGCSGTLASWIATAGTHVTYCVITSGQKGTHDPKTTPEQMAETREREQRAAGEAIGVKEFVFLGHQDGELERTMHLRGEVCQVIRQHRPDVVFTNDPWSHYQLHPDHRDYCDYAIQRDPGPRHASLRGSNRQGIGSRPRGI